MRSFTDTFIRHPVLAIVVNLGCRVPRGWRDGAAGALIGSDQTPPRGPWWRLRGAGASFGSSSCLPRITSTRSS